MYLVVQKRCVNRNSVAFCLDEMANAAPAEYKKKIIQTFLSSSYVGVRKRGLKQLYVCWDKAFEDQITTIWHIHRDLIATKLIIENFPTTFLKSHFLELESQVKKYHHRIRLLLYERTYPSCTEHLAKLAQEDGITYAYISAKLGVVLSIKEAQQLADQYATSERVGILIWALGIMQHWKILARMYNKL